MVRETEIFGTGRTLYTSRHCEVHEIEWVHGSLFEIIHLDLWSLFRPSKVAKLVLASTIPFDTLITREMGGAVIVWRWRDIAANPPNAPKPQST